MIFFAIDFNIHEKNTHTQEYEMKRFRYIACNIFIFLTLSLLVLSYCFSAFMKVKNTQNLHNMKIFLFS